MPLFEPLRDFFQRRKAAKLDQSALGLQIQIEHNEVVRDNFFFPGPTITASILRDGQPIGSIRYGQSPLQDRIYISDFKISDTQRRQGSG
jgi:hypothetical protein